MDSEPRESSPEEIYHELVRATSTADVLTVISSHPNAPLKSKALALRKISRDFKSTHSKAVLNDSRYYTLKEDVLKNVQKLQRQEMCDVLYWLRVMYETYANMEWLGAECIGKLNDRLIALTNTYRFRPTQLINVLYDASVLRLSVSSIESQISSMLLSPETQLNTAETHMLISAFFIRFNTDSEKLVNGLYAYLERTNSLAKCHSPLVLMVLQSLAETTNDYMAQHRPFLLFALREAETRVAQLDDANMSRLHRILDMHSSQMTLTHSVLPAWALRLQSGLILSIKTSILLAKTLFSAHQNNQFEWINSQKSILRLIDRAEKNKEINEIHVEILLNLLVKMKGKLSENELKKVLNYASLYPKNANLALILVNLAINSESQTEFIEDRIENLLTNTENLDFRTICRNISILKGIKSDKFAAKLTILGEKYQEILSKMSTEVDSFASNLYYLLLNEIFLKSPLTVINDGKITFWDGIIFKYIVNSHKFYPQDSESALQKLLPLLTPANLTSVLQPNALNFHFPSLLTVLGGCGRMLTTEGLIAVLRYSDEGMTRVDCRKYGELMYGATGEMYGLRGMGQMWGKVREVVSRAHMRLPRRMVDKMATEALEDLQTNTRMGAIRKATDVLSFLYDHNLLSSSHSLKLQSLLVSPAFRNYPLLQASFPDLHSPPLTSALQSAAHLPYPCSMQQLLTSAVVMRVNSQRSQEMDDQFVRKCGENIRIMTAEEIVKLMGLMKAENFVENNGLSGRIYGEIARFWTESGARIGRNEAFRVFKLMTEAGNYHPALCDYAISQIDPEQLSPDQQVSALTGLGIDLPHITTWLLPILSTIQGRKDLLVRYGSQVLSILHDVNAVHLPQCVDFARCYLDMMGNAESQDHFSFLLAGPYLYRTELMTKKAAETLSQFIHDKEYKAGWEVRLFVLSHLCAQANTPFGIRSTLIPSLHPFFAHPLLNSLAKQYFPSSQLFPKENSLIPLYLPNQHAGVWLHPARIQLARGEELQGDYRLYQSIVESGGCKVVRLPALPRAQLGAVWRQLSRRLPA